MSVNRDKLNRAQALLCLMLDLKMSEGDAEKLLEQAYDYPGYWRRSGRALIRREPQEEKFSVRSR